MRRRPCAAWWRGSGRRRLAMGIGKAASPSTAFHAVPLPTASPQGGKGSGREARVQPIRFAQQGRPGEDVSRRLEPGLALLGGELGGALGRVVEILGAG